MRRAAIGAIGGGLLAVLVVGCGRRVVIDPDEVPSRSSPGWVIKHPQMPSAAAPPASAISGSDAGSHD